MQAKRLPYYGYIGLVLALWAGWILRDRLLVDQKQVGYWLGIIGGSMMLIC
jgi:hypothetical protein